MMKLRTPCLAAALAVSLAGARHAGAGPSVVRDESLTDLGTTPVLGRGYSLATNTFQSICMKEIVKTKPSYDFKYTFTQVEESFAEEIKRSGSFEAAFGANYGFFSVSGRMKGNMKSNTKTNTKTVNIVVTIDVDTYYHSMDESKGELADSAVQLAQKDLPAFFDACGMYYVRSINRNSKIFALFTFDHRSEAQDQQFAAELEAEIRGWGWSGSMRSSMSSESKSSRESTNLKIVTNAQGLGKISGTSLLAYDLESFRKAVQTAFIATQDDDVGRVTSIEIVPWVEHLQFQALMLGNASYTSDGKRNMLINSEFLAEVDRAARAKLNSFYRSKQCRAGIEADDRTFNSAGQSEWVTLDGKSLADAKIVNHRVAGVTRTLKDLWEALVPEKLQVMYNEYDAFMYGGKDDLPVIIQNGRRTYRYDLDASPVVPPTGENRADWAAVAHTALTTLTPQIKVPDAWLLAYGKAYLRGNVQEVPSGTFTTLDDMISKLPATGDTLTHPFTEHMVYLENTQRKSKDFEIKSKTDVVNGVWRLAFNNPASVIESKDGWFGFAAAAILDNDEFANLLVKNIREEIKARTELEVDDKPDVRSLGNAYADKVKDALSERPGAYPSFAAIAQGTVSRLLQGSTEQLGAINTDPIVTAYLLKQLQTFAPDYLTREAKRLKIVAEGEKLTDDKEWLAAKRIYDQYKLLASQGGSMNLGSVGFFGSAEYVGAARCVRDLLRDNRFMKDSYRTIESCRRVESQLGTIRSTMTEDYCLPSPPPPDAAKS